MKITAITGPDGQLVAIVKAHLSEHDQLPRSADVPHATLKPRPGQKFHEVVAPVEFHEKPHAELRSWVAQHLVQRGA
jgi:hypothetical protein